MFDFPYIIYAGGVIVAWPWWIAEMLGLDVARLSRNDNFVYISLIISLVLDAIIIWVIAKGIERLRKTSPRPIPPRWAMYRILAMIIIGLLVGWLIYESLGY